VLGADNVLDAGEATMGAEDFGQYLEEQDGVPGCLFRLGVATDEPVHSAKFDFGHEALESGILMMSNLAIQYLSGR
jgi:amidohydrolase